MVGCYKGFNTKKGTGKGVGQASHSSVVVASLAIFVLDLDRRASPISWASTGDGAHGP
ncbi:MAG: ABC transporter permease [Flavobacteriales bacterium]